MFLKVQVAGDSSPAVTAGVPSISSWLDPLDPGFSSRCSDCTTGAFSTAASSCFVGSMIGMCDDDVSPVSKRSMEMQRRREGIVQYFNGDVDIDSRTSGAFVSAFLGLRDQGLSKPGVA